MNSEIKHSANFYLRRSLTDRIKAVAIDLDISQSAVVALCLESGLGPLEKLGGEMIKAARKHNEQL